MKSVVFGMLAIAGLAGAASADPILVSHPVTGPAVQAYLEDTAPTSPMDVTQVNYDNWTNPGSLLNGLFAAGTNEIADDLHMVAFAGGNQLDTMGLNVANITAPSNLTGGQVAIRFYNFTGGAFLGGFNANLPVLATAAGGSNRLQFAAGALIGFNINLSQDVYCSLQWVSATFSGAGTLADLGFQQRGPINIGTSADSMVNVTTNTTFNFGGNPLANTGIFVTTPAPGTLALLGLGGLFAGRRRR